MLQRFLLAALFLTVAGLYWMTVRPPIQCTLDPQSDELQNELASQKEFQCTPISESVHESDPFQQERTWYDLVVNQNIS
ncbi:unnamed protein product [Allacma fusca]|uniref:Secreted protein n=1 Tax=Allacma fusca TaxID=39272 RepID=A0A8J2KCX0_9HEXA|nr:unnamed protein product [Allacma fusca]